MINSNLLIYKQRILFKILAELDQDLNFQILEINNEKSLEQETKKLDNYILPSFIKKIVKYLEKN